MSFTDDRDGCLFTVTMYRKAIEGSVEPESSSEKSSEIGRTVPSARLRHTA